MQDLESLYQMVAARKANPKEGSYTDYLFTKGLDKILKKVGEETTEVIVAAKNEGTAELQYETVDLQAVLGREVEIREAIKGLVADKGYQFVLFFATDILAEGSQFICEGDTDFVNRAFDIDCTGKSVWMPGVLSRKKQVAAPILAL